MSATGYVPPVPANPPAPLPSLESETVEAWRIHWEPDPRHPPSRPPTWRFDDPAADYLVTYGNEDCYAAFGEVYRDTRVVPKRDADRLLSCLSSSRELSILRLDDPEVLAAFDLQLDISQSREYERTRAWSRAWHGWYGQQIDGLRYLGRKSASRLNYCLYLDRCAGHLEVRTEGRLADLRSTVMRACAGYRIAPALFA